MEDGNVRIETNSETFLIVSEPVAKAIDDQNVRNQLERFTEPLRHEGIESIHFEDENHVGEIITADEAFLFMATTGADPTSQARFKATYQIKRLYFEPGKKWRLSNGSQQIMAEIVDEKFWRSVEAAEVAFSSGDYLICEVRMDQWMDQTTGLKTEYTVEKVLDHVPAPRQSRIPGT